jgi:HSP20 family protein
MEIRRWQKPEMGWSPLDHLTSLKDEINQLFEDPWSSLGRTSRFLNSWAPPVDLFEHQDEFVVRLELPGMKKEDIEVSLNQGVLSISGERKSAEHKEAEPHRAERFFGRFTRSVTLPASVKADEIKANYRNGVLTINLPKTEEAKPKQIQVEVK